MRRRAGATVYRPPLPLVEPELAAQPGHGLHAHAAPLGTPQRPQQPLGVPGRSQEVGRFFETPEFRGRDQGHVFRAAANNDRMAQLKLYTDPTIPIVPELAPAIAEWIKKLK